MLFFTYFQKKLLASWSVRFEGKKKKKKQTKLNNTSCAESLNIGISSFYPAYREEPSVSKPHPGILGRLAVGAHHPQQLTFRTDFWFKVFCFCLTTLWLCYQLEIVSSVQTWSDLLVTGFNLLPHLKCIILKRTWSSVTAFSELNKCIKSCKCCIILRCSKQLVCVFKYLTLWCRLGMKMNPSGELISQRLISLLLFWLLKCIIW